MDELVEQQMNRVHRDTLPPVDGSLSVAPGPSGYDDILNLQSGPIVPGEQHHGFIDHLMRVMMDYGVNEIKRLTLSRGPGGRDCLSVTLGFCKSQARSYRVFLPFGSDPFTDPSWVATDILKQSSAARLTLTKDDPSPGSRYRMLILEYRNKVSLSDVEMDAYHSALDSLWREMSVDEVKAIDLEFPTVAVKDNLGF